MSTSEDDQTGSSSEGGFPQFSDEKHSSTQGHRTDAEDDDYFMADLTAGVDIASMIRGVTISEDDLFDTGPTDPQEQQVKRFDMLITLPYSHLPSI